MLAGPPSGNYSSGLNLQVVGLVYCRINDPFEGRVGGRVSCSGALAGWILFRLSNEGGWAK